MVHGADNPNFKDGVHLFLTPDVTLFFFEKKREEHALELNPDPSRGFTSEHTCALTLAVRLEDLTSACGGTRLLWEDEHLVVLKRTPHHRQGRHFSWRGRQHLVLEFSVREAR